MITSFTRICKYKTKVPKFILGRFKALNTVLSILGKRLHRKLLKHKFLLEFSLLDQLLKNFVLVENLHMKSSEDTSFNYLNCLARKALFLQGHWDLFPFNFNFYFICFFHRMMLQYIFHVISTPNILASWLMLNFHS